MRKIVKASCCPKLLSWTHLYRWIIIGKQVTLLKSLINVSLNLCSIREVQWDNEAWLRVGPWLTCSPTFHHLHTRTSSKAAVTGLQRRDVGRHWPSPSSAGSTTVHYVDGSVESSCPSPTQVPNKSRHDHLEIDHLQFGVAAHGKGKLTSPPKLDTPHPTF